jgi:hypothetical protein
MPNGSTSNKVLHKEKEEEQTHSQDKSPSGGYAVMVEETEGYAVEVDEMHPRIKCTRCTEKGHKTASCTSEVYCVICDKHDHVNFKCPILKMSRPFAHPVGYALYGLGFYHILRPPLARAKRDSKMALIFVESGVHREVAMGSQGAQG